MVRQTPQKSRENLKWPNYFFTILRFFPSDLAIPNSYLELAHTSNIPHLKPWKFLFLDMASSLNYYGAMLQKYPDKPLVPFAILDDPSGVFNEGCVVLACFDGDDKNGDPKVYFHDYSSFKHVNWTDRYCLSNFSEWMQASKKESARYKSEIDENE